MVSPSCLTLDAVVVVALRKEDLGAVIQALIPSLMKGRKETPTWTTHKIDKLLSCLLDLFPFR